MTDCHGESGRSQEEGGGVTGGGVLIKILRQAAARLKGVSSIMTVIISILLFTIMNYQW